MLRQRRRAPGAAGGGGVINSAGGVALASAWRHGRLQGIPGQSLNPHGGALGAIKGRTEGAGDRLSASQAAGLALTDTCAKAEKPCARQTAPFGGRQPFYNSSAGQSVAAAAPNSAVPVCRRSGMWLCAVYTTSVDVPVGPGRIWATK